MGRILGKYCLSQKGETFLPEVQKEKTEFEKKAESTSDRLSSLISGQANDKEKKEEKLASTSKVSGDMWG